ncbi:MAG: DNA repair protein RadA [Clostridia bacterium]|nr:DNA repair protein RadA [Clostridia bacterium]
MATKSKLVYVCTQCGKENTKWYGQCPGCGEWNTLVEEFQSKESFSKKQSTNAVHIVSNVKQLSGIESETMQRFGTGMKELDRVLGGGIVRGSIVLLGGDPGIGKSTIFLQICEYLGNNMKILYVSGEESAHQIKMRAKRLGVNTENLYILAETDILGISEYVKSENYDMVIVDSIQTMNLTELTSSPGSVSQIRECTSVLMQLGKSLDIPIFVIGHVNKDGAIAGPKVLEHIVDTVLYFEGERHLSYRILRAVKNRFGSTNEIGVFEMANDGLREVENPSLMLISGRPQSSSGTCIACINEGSRIILSEVQGLVTPTGFGTPRRMATGFDYNRLSMIIAVLEKRCGYFFGNMDAYVNVIGGIKLNEPAADLTVAVTLISSLKDLVVPDDVIAFGEVGLAGEIRAVNNCDMRVTEAARLGFRKCIIPYNNLKSIPNEIKKDIEIVGVKTIRQAFESLV